MDQCSCKCFHEAQWTCEGSSVVCKAKLGAGELKTVGDKVCESRGAPKPASTLSVDADEFGGVVVELPVASSCVPKTEMRGSSPTAQCLAQWGTPAPTDAPETTQEAEETPAEKKMVAPFIEESFATTFALAALALYA